MKAETLKKSILQYAMQGKLVEQDPNDEPASILLARIKAEKEQLIKDGKIKKEKSLPPITEDEIPYELPKGWEWVRFQNITKVLTCGYASTPQYYPTGRTFLSAKNVKPYKFMPENHKFISEELYQTLIQNGKPEKGDILMTRVGAGIGESAIIDVDMDFAIYVSLTLIKLFKNNINPKYILHWLNSPYGTEKATKHTFGKGCSQGNLNVNQVKTFVIPLPPLAEQQRIVEKLEQILPVVDEYGKNEEKLSKLNSTLPDKIKQSILQYAVQGKLVPQNPSDEPASELLKRIKAEKEQLIKDGKIKKEKSLPPISADELPYELPQGWEWVRLGNIGISNIGLTYKPADITNTNEGIPVLRSSNIQNDKINLNDLVRVTTEIKNENLFVQSGDILICARNGSKNLVGKAAIMEKLDEPMTFGAFMAIFRSSVNNWVKIYLASPLFKKTLESVNTVTINQITQSNLKNAIIPLPPLAEQQRIVEKVEELLSIVDNLKV